MCRRFVFAAAAAACVGVGLFLASPAAGAEPPSAAAVSQQVNSVLAAKQQAAGLQTAANCDDATFLRRVHLDTIGTLPTVAEARAFLADKRADKRAAQPITLFLNALLERSSSR